MRKASSGAKAPIHASSSVGAPDPVGTGSAPPDLLKNRFYDAASPVSLLGCAAFLHSRRKENPARRGVCERGRVRASLLGNSRSKSCHRAEEFSDRRLM